MSDYNDYEYSAYTFNAILAELERTGEILRLFESGEMPPSDDNILSDDEEE